MGLASASLASCLEVVPEATRLWKPEQAPQATVMNSVGNNVPRLTFQPAKAGISKVTFPAMAEKTMPTRATSIMPYSRKLER